MKMNQELMHEILIRLEAGNGREIDLSFEGYDEQEIMYQAKILYEMGYAKGINASYADGSRLLFDLYDLTVEGHKYLKNMEQKFSLRQVQRSFRKFNDIVNDLLNSHFETWGHQFTHLINHCEKDPVMCVVTHPLKSNGRVDARQWYRDLNLGEAGIGGARYQLPTDDDDRTALLYQFFLFVEEDDEFKFSLFCMKVFGTGRYQEMVSLFNRELLLKFTREVSYRLKEILEDSGGQQEIPREAMLVFHQHNDYSMNIKGNIEGSNIASGGSNISHSSAQSHKIVNQAEVLEALQKARQSIDTLPPKEQQKAEVFIGELEEEASSGQPVTSNGLFYAAGLLPLLEAAGTAADVISKIKNIFGGTPS